jgi:hypothetical protein
MGDEIGSPNGSRDGENKDLDRREVAHKLLIELLASVLVPHAFIMPLIISLETNLRSL